MGPLCVEATATVEKKNHLKVDLYLGNPCSSSRQILDFRLYPSSCPSPHLKWLFAAEITGQPLSCKNVPDVWHNSRPLREVNTAG